MTGNGSWDGQKNFGESVLKLSSTLSLLDWFTPDNYNLLNGGDLDLGVAGIVLIPNTNLSINGSKTGELYVLRQDNLGHLQVDNGQIPQILSSRRPHTWLAGILEQPLSALWFLCGRRVIFSGLPPERDDST